MINFKKFTLEDLDKIYQNERLRPLITVMPKGVKFGVAAVENQCLIGGASGYTVDNAAFIQCMIFLYADTDIYKDGLLRSLIHFLEQDGITYLFANEKNQILEKIGFVDYKYWNGPQLSDTIKEDIISCDSMWINLKEFFT